jgi:hypothetical protein
VEKAPFGSFSSCPSTLLARPSPVQSKASGLLGHVIVLRVEHHMLLLPIAYELFESRVVCDVSSPSFPHGDLQQRKEEI